MAASSGSATRSRNTPERRLRYPHAAAAPVQLQFVDCNSDASHQVPNAPSEVNRFGEVARIEMLHQLDDISPNLADATIEYLFANVDREAISPTTERAWTDPLMANSHKRCSATSRFRVDVGGAGRRYSILCLGISISHVLPHPGSSDVERTSGERCASPQAFNAARS